MRGFLCASMNILPNDPKLAELSSEDLLFMYHYKKKYINDLKIELGVMLGTHWTPESVHAQPKKRKIGPEQKEYDFPLALLLNPKLGKGLKEMVRKPVSKKHGEFEFEDIHGVNLIRQHQKRLLQKAASILSA